jgi:uncharacterized protein involved in exopolysaccharide biosynthesis
VVPLKVDRLQHHEIIHRLKFEEVISEDFEKAGAVREQAEAKLAELYTRIAPVEAEINQLGRQFWVDKKQVVDNKYDLSANHYRDFEYEHAFTETPAVTLDRLQTLEKAAESSIATLGKLIAQT